MLVVLACSGIGGGCAAPFGPGYTVEKQNIDVHFEPGPPPHISIKTEYQLKNTGTRELSLLELSLLELRLPGRRRFKPENVAIEWDGKALEAVQSAENAREAFNARVTERNDVRCIELMRNFIRDKPQLWNEDIGV